MPGGKTPGLNGFPIEWYKMFIDLLLSKFYQVYEEIVDKGMLSPTFN